MDIVDLTDSPAPVPDKGKGKKRQTEGSSPQPKKRKSTADPSGPTQQSKKAKSPKAKPEKRTDAAGRTVRFASAPSQKIKERIDRAMPGTHVHVKQLLCIQHFTRSSMHQFLWPISVPHLGCQQFGNCRKCYVSYAGSGHRLFLIDRKLISPVGSEGGPVEEFNVLGATANGELVLSSPANWPPLPIHLCLHGRWFSRTVCCAHVCHSKACTNFISGHATFGQLVAKFAKSSPKETLRK